MALTTMDVKLTYGTTTVNLYPLEGGYVPEAGNGEDDLTEKMEIHIAGTSTQIKATIASIEQLMGIASKGPDDPTYRVYLQLRMADADDFYRSQVLDGRLDYKPLSVEGGWTVGNIPATLTIQRVGYWEGPQTQIPLTNQNETGNTSGLAVYNCNDGSGTAPAKRNNYFYTGAISGDLETPAIIELASLGFTKFGNGVAYLGMWNNTRQGLVAPADTLFTVEMGTDQVSAAASNGTFHRLSWSGTTDTVLATIVTTGLVSLNMFGGNWFRPIIRLQAQPSAGERFWLQWGMYYTVSTVDLLWGELSGKVLLTDTDPLDLVELPPLQIPPTLRYDLVTLANMTIVFRVVAEGAGNHTLDVDFVVFMPLDGFRKYIQGSQPVDANLTDDGVAGICYGNTGLTGVVPYGEPIMLKPWEPNHEFHFIETVGPDSGGAAITEAVTVKLWYRPRRKALG